MKHEITMKEDMSDQGKPKWNLEYLSTATIFFSEYEGLGSKKSMEILSKGFADGIAFAMGGL